MGQIAYMPVLVLAARLCPPGVEATLFALLMSVTNLAGLLSYEFGAGLMHWLGVTETNFDRLWLLVLITNLSTLLPLPLLGWLPNQRAGEVEPPIVETLPPAAAAKVDLSHTTSLTSEVPIPELVPIISRVEEGSTPTQLNESD
jgi:hypothetical protein